MSRPGISLTVTLTLLFPLAVSAAAAEPADLEAELRAAELAFAASVADGDQERFATFLDDDAVFVGASVLRGRDAIVQAWSVFFAPGGPRLEWRPETVEVRADGLGLTRGPYTLRQPGAAGSEVASSGLFTSIWRRQADGSWRILFDSGCPPGAGAADPDG